MFSLKQFTAVLFVSILVFTGCSEQNNSNVSLPAEMREHMNFADFLSSQQKSSSEYVLLFDNNKDSNPDSWEYWDLTKKPPLQRMEADKDFNGSIDTWQYFDPKKEIYQERDTNGDGKVDRWLYRDGKIRRN